MTKPSPSEVEERFNAIVEEFGMLLRRAIVRHCPRDKGLEFDDIEQEARLRLWRAIEAEREVTNYASYLYRIGQAYTLTEFLASIRALFVSKPTSGGCEEFGCGMNHNETMLSSSLAKGPPNVLGLTALESSCNAMEL